MLERATQRKKNNLVTDNRDSSSGENSLDEFTQDIQFIY